jgi:hypothetical protein
LKHNNAKPDLKGGFDERCLKEKFEKESTRTKKKDGKSSNTQNNQPPFLKFKTPFYISSPNS